MNAQKVKSIAAVLFGVLLVCSQLAFAMEPSINILGDVVGSGKAEMNTAFDKWISVSGKTFPVIDGAHLRSKDGMMSLIFRDAVKIEVGKNSEISVTGSRGNYSIDISSGQMAFSVPRGISFSVKTPTSTIQTKAASDMIQKVNLVSQDEIRGIVVYDGKGTKITAISGTLTVQSGLGVQLQTVAAGNAIYIDGKDMGRVTTTQLADPPTGGGYDDKDWTPFWVVGGGTAAIVGGYFWANSYYHVSGHD